MIDHFSIILSHMLIAFSVWRLLRRDDLDAEAPPAPDLPAAAFGKPHARRAPPSEAHEHA